MFFRDNDVNYAFELGTESNHSFHYSRQIRDGKTKIRFRAGPSALEWSVASLSETLSQLMRLMRLTHLLLVAITRAQALLIVVGDPELLGTDELWRTFLNYIILGRGHVGKEPNWNPKDRVHVPRYTIIPRNSPVYGEGFINGKSEKIYRYLGE